MGCVRPAWPMSSGAFPCRWVLSTVIVTVLTVSPAFAQSFAFAVRKDQVFGASRGTLLFDAERVEYRTADTNDARQWAYEDIQQIQVLSPTRLTIKTYEDQGWLKLGADRSFEFELTDGVVPPELVAFVWDRVPFPVVAAVFPEVDGAPAQVVPVRLRERFAGTSGELRLYDDRLVYATDAVGHGRAWRPADLRMVYQPDRHRLDVDAYEGGGDRIRTFSFDLKRPLPAGFLDSVWQWLHAPVTARIGEREARR